MYNIDTVTKDNNISGLYIKRFGNIVSIYFRYTGDCTSTPEVPKTLLSNLPPCNTFYIICNCQSAVFPYNAINTASFWISYTGKLNLYSTEPSIDCYISLLYMC